MSRDVDGCRVILCDFVKKSGCALAHPLDVYIKVSSVL